MSTKAATSLLLSAFLYGATNAFVPMNNIHPPIDNYDAQPAISSEINTAHWAPVATLVPASTSSIPTTTPAPSLDEYQILPVGLDANAVPELKKRQVTGQGAPAAATEITQVSPITTYFVNSEVAPGSFAQVPVVYTQTFPPIPDQWSSAVPGTIGLGTLTGTVGGVRTKRSEPTQMPLAAAEDKQIEESGAVSTLTPTTLVSHDAEGDNGPILLDVHNGAGRALQAGTLAILAVGIATMCVSYL